MNSSTWDDIWLMKHCGMMLGDPESWPYREDFESLTNRYKVETGKAIASFREVYLRYMYLRKKRFSTKPGEPALPNFSPSKDPAPKLDSKYNIMLIKLYGQQSRSCDRLPYSNQFESLYQEFLIQSGLNLSKREVWRVLLDLRKNNKLPHKGVKVIKEHLQQNIVGFSKRKQDV